jgi:hypothetical protein
MKIKVIQSAYHRNGVMGNPFDVVLFEHEGTKKVAIVFEDSRSIAVLDIAMLNQDIIEYPNRWRGDEFEADIREAICPMVEEEA